MFNLTAGQHSAHNRSPHLLSWVWGLDVQRNPRVKGFCGARVLKLLSQAAYEARVGTLILRRDFTIYMVR